MPAFWKSLAVDTSDAARMLRFIILTATRYGEAVGMQPGEVKGNLWRIPPGRMKNGKEQVVPLVPAALDQLPFRPVSDVSLAKTIQRYTDTPATTHGMRSTFRDWAGDRSHFSRKIAEAALAHTLGEAERAYRRGDALAKRRDFLADWGPIARRRNLRMLSRCRPRSRSVGARRGRASTSKKSFMLTRYLRLRKGGSD